MTKKIIYIKPSSVDSYNEDIAAHLRRYCQSDTEISVVSMPFGPRHLEYRLYEALTSWQVLKAVKQAENDGYDGAILGCFYDPDIFTAREICTKMCVSTPAESAVKLATSLGNSFSVIIGQDKWIAQMDENLRTYGVRERLASFRSLGLSVPEFQAKPQETHRRLREAARRAVEEDGAEVLILGCTMEYGFFTELQKEFGVPVIDVMLAGLKYCELLVETKQKMGWYTSKVGGYATPPLEEIRQWNIPEDYGMAGLW